MGAEEVWILAFFGNLVKGDDAFSIAASAEHGWCIECDVREGGYVFVNDNALALTGTGSMEWGRNVHLLYAIYYRHLNLCIHTINGRSWLRASPPLALRVRC